MAKMGRPPKPKKEVKREVITFVVTIAEKARYQSAASESGSGMSSWIRGILNAAVPAERKDA